MRACLHKVIAGLFAPGVCSVLFCVAGVQAVAQTVATVQKFETEKHNGSPEEALVGLIVTNTAEDGSVQVRHGNGVFIRCDGFIMAPEALFSLANTPGTKVGKPNQTVTVVLHPGTDHEQRLATRRPRDSGVLNVGDRWYRLTYTVLKLDDIHNPAPRLLSPDALGKGDPLRVLSSTWSEADRRFLPAVTTQEGVRQPPEPLLPTETGAAAAIPLFSAQTTPFLQTAPPLPQGAVVVGPDSMIVGMVTDAAEAGAAAFANLASMDQVTNCVGVLPNTDKQYAELTTSKAPGDDPADSSVPTQAPVNAERPLISRGDMVSVAGGPLKIPTVLKAYEPDMENVYDACIAPFQIDKFEVTNAQYLEFWSSLSRAKRKDSYTRSTLYPLGWGDEKAPFPADLAQVPVLGVRVSGAKAFAKWAGKRLPTPYEWCMAAFGRYGGNRPPEWADKYMRAREVAWERIIQAHIQYALQHPEIVPGFRTQQGITGAFQVDPDWSRPVVEEFCQLPWFFLRPGFAQAAAWSHDCVRQNTESLFANFVDPGYILPVGSRPYDVSPCGAQDMIMNARELVLPGPHGAWKKLPNDHWGYAEADRYMEVDWVQAGLLTRPWFRNGLGVFDLGTPASTENPVRVGSGLAIVNVESLLKSSTLTMSNTNLLIAHAQHNEPFNISTVIIYPGSPFTDSQLPLTSIDNPVPAETDSKVLGLYHPVNSYEFRMPSRRIRSAGQNAQAGSSGFVPADLGDYVTACSAVQEYSEQLRPVDTCMLNLVPGPTYDVPYWTSTGTWGYGSTFLISGPATSRRVGKVVVRGSAIGDIGLNEWTADGTCIGMTGSFASWSAGPDHYHVEIGRQGAVDARYPINSRIVNNVSLTGFAPDTFLIPGGFRCAR